MKIWLGLAMGLVMAAAACTPAPDARLGWRDGAVTSEPAPLGGVDGEAYGPLRFAGGLVLTSHDRLFGGFSGLEVDENGELTAVSDAGAWLRGQISTDARGRLSGLADMRLARMTDPGGRALIDKYRADAEGLAALPNGRFAVSFERNHRIWLYDLAAGPEAPAIRGGSTIWDSWFLEPNEGLEALASYKDGLLAGAERSPKGGETWWWILPLVGDDAPRPGVAPLSPGFALVGLDQLPPAFGGDYVALERFYTPVTALRTRLRRVSAAGLAAGRFEGPLIAELATPLLLDNFEGVSAVATPTGARLYLMSDDNFRSDQRTLLYAFDWEASPS